MTYLLTVLLKEIWNEGLSAEGGPSIKIVELCLVVEQALSFMHTRNMAVLLTWLMSLLWISQGLLKDRWPCFNQELVHFGSPQRIEWKIKQWPFDKQTCKPILSAYTGQKFYHIKNHTGVRIHKLYL